MLLHRLATLGLAMDNQGTKTLFGGGDRCEGFLDNVPIPILARANLGLLLLQLLGPGM